MTAVDRKRQDTAIITGRHDNLTDTQGGAEAADLRYEQQVHSSSQGCHIATGTRMPHGITQCYLPPGRGDIPALTPAEAGTRLSDPGGMQG